MLWSAIGSILEQGLAMVSWRGSAEVPAEDAWGRRCAACFSVCKCCRVRARRLGVGGACQVAARIGRGVMGLRVNEQTEQNGRP